jgi:hypothetical protein
MLALFRNACMSLGNACYANYSYTFSDNSPSSSELEEGALLPPASKP